MPSSSHASDFDSDSPRYSDASISGSEWPAEPRLRGLRWRVLLSVLPPCPAPIESLRRAAANGRRRYAELRRRLIVDPHSLEDTQKGENLNVNNPLSQDPDSIWGRYFKNTELERIIESDLTRLYPEHGSFFQSLGCQAMLRRILLVWALIYPQYGYRQGMHEVLAPLVYVLHVDVTHLSQVQQRYEDPFEDSFGEEGFSFYKDGGRQATSSVSGRSTLRVPNDRILTGEEDWIRRVHPEDLALVEADDFGFNLKTMVLGSDSYGAEGELGALLSARFVEHDAYCMFDALMRGQGGAVVLADYFSAVNEGGAGLSPVLEASANIYHSLAAVDMPLYIHLVGLGVEPQFFALRWLRVLFGREFDLEKLLLLWDAIFNASSSGEESVHSSGPHRNSARGSFISNFAVSMILYLRSTLLAASNATACLQKLLNFPKHVDIRNLIENAKTLQMHSEERLKRTPSPGSKYSWIVERSRGSKHKSFSRSPSFQAHFLSSRKVLQQLHSGSPEMSRPPLPESYWEERWISSILPKEEPSSSSASVMEYEPTNVQGSIIVSEELLMNSASGGNETLENAQSNEADKNKGSRRNLLTDALDGVAHFTDLSVGVTADALKLEGSSNADTLCVHRNERNEDSSALAAAIGVLSSAEVTSGAGEEDNNEHICIRALDLNAITTKNDQLPEAAECLCSLCNYGFQEQMQHSRSVSAGDLTIPTNGEISEGFERIENLNFSVGSTKVSCEKHLRASLQLLGRSMVESIQVLEGALSSLAYEGGPPAAHKETSELMSNALLDARGQVTAVRALTDLKKISSILLQI